MVIEVSNVYSTIWGSITSLLAIIGGVYSYTIAKHNHNGKYVQKEEYREYIKDTKDKIERINSRIDDTNGLSREMLGILKGLESRIDLLNNQVMNK